jgi:hypothetical protein
MRFRDLWDWRGEIDRGPYLLWGALLMAIKYNLDRFVAAAMGRDWWAWHYLVPSTATPLRAGEPSNARFYATLVAVALPFIWVGVILTLRRLRSAGLPLWLVGLFFAPFINYLFFLILAIVPRREALREPRRESWATRWVPRSELGAAVAGILVTVPLSLGLAVLAFAVFRDYGWGVFVGIPFWIGLDATLLYTVHAPRRLGMCLLVSFLSVCLTGGIIFAAAMEGVICLLMAAPIAVPIALLGGLVGYAVQPRRPGMAQPAQVFPALILAMPLLLGSEHAAHLPPPSYAITSAIEIDAPPEHVWPKVVEFSEIDEPPAWYFRAGIAYPMRARIDGTGVGATRHCIFTTGEFVEPIRVWDEPRELGFGVSAQPAAMSELSPYRNLHPAHLDGYFRATAGRFVLVPLPGRRTRLEGTTWYVNQFWPEWYWKQWSDGIVHRIHMRVLAHIKRDVESQKQAERRTPRTGAANPQE